MGLTTDRSLLLSMRCYRGLLRAYPRAFLAEFEELLCQAFGDLAHRAVRTKGNWGLFVLWMRKLPDLASSAFGQRFQLNSNWGFRLRWISACGVGVLLATVLFLGPGYWILEIQKSLVMVQPNPATFPLVPRVSVSESLAAFRILRNAAVLGLILGFFQARTLQWKRFKGAAWIIATLIGTMITAYGFMKLPAVSRQLRLGIHPWQPFVDQHEVLFFGGWLLLNFSAVAMLQIFVLARGNRRAILWIPASAFALFACRPFLTFANSSFAILALGAVYGLLTVLPLEWILQPRVARDPVPVDSSDLPS